MRGSYAGPNTHADLGADPAIERAYALEARHDRCDRWLTAVMDAATSHDAPAIERIAEEVFTVDNRAAEDVFAVADAVRKGEPYARALDTLARRLDKLAYEVPDYE